MEYSIQQLARLTGVSTRTLRWYDQIGLLKPKGYLENGYRCYGAEEVDRLQQILFYRALGVELKEIASILDDSQFDRTEALRRHLIALREKQSAIDALIQSVQKTLDAIERETPMKDDEKFEALKQSAVEENEQRYGAELREKYGDEQIDESNVHAMHLTQQQYETWKELDSLIRSKLEYAVESGMSPMDTPGEEIALLHKRWLSITQKQYSAEKQRGIAMLYVLDERFTAYYDKNVAGCAAFLNEAILCWIHA